MAQDVAAARLTQRRAEGRLPFRRLSWHIAAMVRFSQVGLRYPDPVRRGAAGERETLRDLSFTLPQGSFTWLTGPSGAGKTSLLRMMQLSLRPTRGEVEVLGVSLLSARRGDLPKLRRRIGAVFQEFRLLPYLTAFDNVALPLRLAGRPEAGLRPDVTEMLRWVGLEGREDSLPRQLSGGEQQRVAIARAVVTRPALLLADEPTGNLDAGQARRLMLLLAEMNRLGSTVVVATHSRDLIAQHPGQVMALDEGRILSLDPWPHPRGEVWAEALPEGPSGVVGREAAEEVPHRVPAAAAEVFGAGPAGAEAGPGEMGLEAVGPEAVEPGEVEPGGTGPDEMAVDAGRLRADGRPPPSAAVSAGGRFSARVRSIWPGSRPPEADLG
ncbi:cell division ATP-binding protein FtsE [Roseomonas sp. KE2513]|uniref:cell division ATP-binding protein FtsE n=1 Tax=Roseomonas sp. KE2513 TaxID=2479202 RepID=UPI001E44E8ED|nr:ATP-binding cassette domain-containing protein [Roseomonas sp. KE2513]